MSGRLGKFLPWISTAVAIVLMVVIWKLVIAIFDVSPFVLPQPEDVVSGVRELVNSNGFWTDVRVTLTETLVGFGIALALGLGLGILLGRVVWLEQAMRPVIVASQVVPKVAPPGTNIVFFDEHSATQQALLSGQVDAIGGAAFLINALAQRNPDKGIETKFIVTTAYYGIAVKPGNFDLLQWVNTWVFVNKQNGVLAKIYEEHTGVKLVDLPTL